MSKVNYLYYLAKTFDLGVVGIYFLVLGIATSILITKIVGDTPKGRPRPKMTPSMLALKILFRTFLIMVSAYMIRNLVEIIPFPLDGVGGFEHKRIRELDGGVMLAFAIIEFQPEYIEDIRQLVAYFKNQ